MPTLEPIGPDRVEELRAVLASDPVQNLYLLGVLEEHGITGRLGGAPVRFFGLRDDGALRAAAFAGGSLVIPCVPDPGAATALGKLLAGQVTLKGSFGERYAVDALFWALGGGTVRVSRPQRLFTVTADALGPQIEPRLVPATPADADDLLAASAAWVRELRGRDPLAEDPAGFRARAERRIAAGRTFLVRVDGRLAVKLDVGIRSQHGAEIEGIYTVREFRRRGMAVLALGQLCRSLLATLPRLTIRADEQDAALAALCRKVGFTPTRPQRLLLLD